MLSLPKIYSQKDGKWAKEKLGFSTTSELEDYGCLDTVLAMVASYYGHVVNPKEINDLLKKNQGFMGDLYAWGGLFRCFGDIKERRFVTPSKLTDAQMQAIRDAIDKGFPVMLWLDYNPKTVKNDMHWVLAIGYNPADENDLTIADPIDGTVKSLKKYLGWLIPSARRTIETYVIYEGKVPTTPVPSDERSIVLTLPLIEKMANAIKKHEGWFIGSRAYRNNNPGNLVFTDYVKNSLGSVRMEGGSNGRFAVWDTPEAGFMGLMLFIYHAATDQLRAYQSDMTLYDYFAKYAPSSDGNTPKTYAEAVMKDMGVSASFRLKNLLGTKIEANPATPSAPVEVPVSAPVPEAPKVKLYDTPIDWKDADGQSRVVGFYVNEWKNEQTKRIALEKKLTDTKTSLGELSKML